MELKMSKYFVEEHITINADIDTVWGYMIGWDSYPRWNPFIVKVDYRASKNGQGDIMVFSLAWHDGRKGSSIEQMISSTPPENGSAELKYKYAHPVARLGLLRATRVQKLQSKGNQTEYSTREEYHGILARFVPLDGVKKGFTAQANALAKIASGKME
jgi:hypothetical protein